MRTLKEKTCKHKQVKNPNKQGLNAGKSKSTLLKPKTEIEHCCPQIKKLSSFHEIFIAKLLSYTTATSTQAVLVLEEALVQEIIWQLQHICHYWSDYSQFSHQTFLYTKAELTAAPI